MKRWWRVLAAVVVVLGCAAGLWFCIVNTTTTGGRLELAGLLDSDEGPPLAVAECSTDRPPELKSCPEFKSANPVFGQVHFRSGAEGNDPWESMHFYVAFDEIRGTGTGYNIVYFDANGNLDLTDDGPETRIGSDWHPSGAGRTDGTSTQADMPPEAKVGLPSYWVTPDLPAWGQRGLWVTFRPDYCRKGDIRIAGRKYEVRLSTASITGRYDTPLTKFVLYRPPTRLNISWPGVFGPQAEEKISGPPGKVWYIMDRWWNNKRRG